MKRINKPARARAHATGWLLLALCATGLATTPAAQAECRVEAMQVAAPDWEATAQDLVRGTITLCVEDDRTVATVELERAPRKYSYSAWWLLRMGPNGCEARTEDDRFWNCPDVYSMADGEPAALGRLGSGVAARDGTLYFRDVLRGFSPPPGMQVEIVVVDHGKLQRHDGPRMARQLLTPEAYWLGDPGLGNFYDWFAEPYAYEVGWATYRFD